MKINNKKIIIPENKVENVEGELVMYSQVSKKIIVFNHTASIVWNIIKESNDKDIDLSLDYLSEKVIQFYNIPNTQKPQVVNDVEELIDQFIKEKVIIETEC